MKLFSHSFLLLYLLVITLSACNSSSDSAISSPSDTSSGMQINDMSMAGETDAGSGSATDSDADIDMPTADTSTPDTGDSAVDDPIAGVICPMDITGLAPRGIAGCTDINQTDNFGLFFASDENNTGQFIINGFLIDSQNSGDDFAELPLILAELDQVPNECTFDDEATDMNDTLPSPNFTDSLNLPTLLDAGGIAFADSSSNFAGSATPEIEFIALPDSTFQVVAYNGDVGSNAVSALFEGGNNLNSFSTPVALSQPVEIINAEGFLNGGTTWIRESASGDSALKDAISALELTAITAQGTAELPDGSQQEFGCIAPEAADSFPIQTLGISSATLIGELEFTRSKIFIVELSNLVLVFFSVAETSVLF